MKAYVIANGRRFGPMDYEVAQYDAYILRKYYHSASVEIKEDKWDAYKFLKAFNERYKRSVCIDTDICQLFLNEFPNEDAQTVENLHEWVISNGKYYK